MFSEGGSISIDIIYSCIYIYSCMTGIHDSMCNSTDSSSSIDILYSGSVAVIHVVLIAYIISCTHMIYSGVKVVVLTTYTWQWQYRYHIQRFLCVRCSLKSCNKFQNKPERIVCPFTLRVYSVWNSPFSPLKKLLLCAVWAGPTTCAHQRAVVPCSPRAHYDTKGELAGTREELPGHGATRRRREDDGEGPPAAVQVYPADSGRLHGCIPSSVYIRPTFFLPISFPWISNRIRIYIVVFTLSSTGFH